MQKVKKENWKDNNWFFSRDLNNFRFGYELTLLIGSFLGAIGWISYSILVLENEVFTIIGMLCFVPWIVFNLWRLS